MPMPAQPLLAAAKAARVTAVLSRDAGRYLCNYLCWRASEAVTGGGPRLTAFVHVPPVARVVRPMSNRSAFFSVRPRESGDPGAKELDSRFRGKERRMGRPHSTNSKSNYRYTSTDLLRAGQNLLVALVAAVNRV